MYHNQVVLITGANRGIGLATSKKFLEEGYTVVLTSRDAVKGRQAVESLGMYSNLYFFQLDISDDKSVETCIDSVIQYLGRIDILINNAGVHYDPWQDPLNVDMNQVLDALNVNSLGAWRMSNATIPIMKRQHFGRIINVSSGIGSLTSISADTPAYSLSKAALNIITIKLSKALEHTPICINALCPGWVQTDMGGNHAPKSPLEAAEGIYWLAQQDHLNGKFVRDRNIIPF